LQSGPLVRRAIRRRRRGHASCVTRRVMTDIVFIVATVAFFALAVAYTHACERL
jgi:hypothetical protein